MKRTLSIGLVALTLLLSVGTIVPQVTHAQTNPSSSPTSGAGATAAGSGTTVANNPTSSGPGSTASIDASYDWIMANLMSLFAWLAGAAMIILDSAVYYTVVTMGSYVNNLSAIGTAWTILRDIGNIVLIFGFIAIGIGIIVGSNFYGGGTKMLPTLLIAAVFLNFSLFISEAVIDVGNLFATQFYTQINGGVPAGSKAPSLGSGVSGVLNAPGNFNDAVLNEGISNKIMAQLGLTTIYNVNFAQNKEVFKAGNMWIIGFMSIILFLILAFVLFSLAFVLISRFVYLIFLIIVAPIGFAGLAVPKLSGFAKDWWKNLFEQTITAPILMLLLYVALLVITSPAFLTGVGIGNPETAATAYLSLFTGGENPGNLASVLLAFMVAMGLLLAVVVASKKLSAFGAEAASKWGSRLSFGLSSYALGSGLNAVGLGGRTALQRFAPNSRISRFATQYAFRPLENIRPDVRRVPGVGAGLKAVGLAAVAAPVAGSALGRVRQGREYLEKMNKEEAQKYSKETAIPRLKEAIEGKNYDEADKILSNLSDKDAESVHKALSSNPGAAAGLSQSRFDKLMGSEALSADDKKNLRSARERGITERHTDTREYKDANGATKPSVRNPGTNMTQGEFKVRSLTNEAVANLPSKTLAEPDVHQNLTIRQINAIMRAGKIDDTTAATIGAHLAGNHEFMTYLGTRLPSQERDIRDFWHI